jgi:hypothetical protein
MRSFGYLLATTMTEIRVTKITPEQLAKLQQKADQHLARLQAAKARLAETERKMDTRRKIIAGGLLFDAAAKDPQWARHLDVLLTRIDRPNDKEPFEGWSIEQYKAEGGKLGARKQARLEVAADEDEARADESVGAAPAGTDETAGEAQHGRAGPAGHDDGGRSRPEPGGRTTEAPGETSAA